MLVITGFGAAIYVHEQQRRILKEIGEIETVEEGETRSLTYFEYSNRLPEHIVHVNNRILEEQSRAFKFPILDPTQLGILLLPVTGFPNPSRFSYGAVNIKLGDRQSHIEIAGGRFVEEIAQWSGGPPTNDIIEAFLSTAHSLALVHGHFELAIKKGQMSAEDALENRNKYLQAILNPDLPVMLPSWNSDK